MSRTSKSSMHWLNFPIPSHKKWHWQTAVVRCNQKLRFRKMWFPMRSRNWKQDTTFSVFSVYFVLFSPHNWKKIHTQSAYCKWTVWIIASINQNAIYPNKKPLVRLNAVRVKMVTYLLKFWLHISLIKRKEMTKNTCVSTVKCLDNNQMLKLCPKVCLSGCAAGEKLRRIWTSITSFLQSHLDYHSGTVTVCNKCCEISIDRCWYFTVKNRICSVWSEKSLGANKSIQLVGDVFRSKTAAVDQPLLSHTQSYKEPLIHPILV